MSQNEQTFPNDLITSNAPHVSKKNNTTQRIMLDVIIALVPACIASILIFGHLVAINIALCVIFCMASELLYNLIYHKNSSINISENSVWDLSSVVTGIILALNLPTHITVFSLSNITSSNGTILFSPDTVFACLFGSIFAIMLVKMLFGGIGKNLFNPAATARIFLMLCFSLTFVNISSLGESILSNAVTGATPLQPSAQQPSLLNMFVGTIGSSAVGETCKIALILGYIYLSIKKVIDFRIPLMVIGSTLLFAFLLKGVPDLVNNISIKQVLNYLAIQLLSGGLIFGAIFMATDYSTTPNTLKGNIVFALGIGLITMLIRVFGAYPEGFSFALVMMNIFVPLIDKHILRKPFGIKRRQS